MLQCMLVIDNCNSGCLLLAFFLSLDHAWCLENIDLLLAWPVQSCSISTSELWSGFGKYTMLLLTFIRQASCLLWNPRLLYLIAVHVWGTKLLKPNVKTTLRNWVHCWLVVTMSEILGKYILSKWIRTFSFIQVRILKILTIENWNFPLNELLPSERTVTLNSFVKHKNPCII